MALPHPGRRLQSRFTTTPRFTDGFRNLSATVAFLVCEALSLLFLELATRTIPLGTGYAIRTGMDAIGTVATGMIWFAEPATVVRRLLIFGIIRNAIGLKLTSGH